MSSHTWGSQQVDAMEAILTRRSIRKYTSEPVTDDEVKQLLRAAMHAPVSWQPETVGVHSDQGQRDAQ